MHGNILPGERDLSQLTGVSRITVRKAMQALEEEGVVTRSRGYGTQINNMRDKLIDVGLSVTGVPAPFMMELEASHAVHLIPLTKKEMDTVLAKQPYWSAGVIKKGTYKSTTEDVDAVAFWNVAITSKRLSEDTVYTLTKAGFEAQAQLANAVRDIEHMKPEDILKSTIPLHKGAIRYYRERGIQIPDRLIPPEAK